MFLKYSLNAVQVHERLCSEVLKYCKIIFLFIYLTLNLLKEVSLQIIFTIYCYILHFQFLVKN